MSVRDALTARELELVKLAALGMRNRHIGWRLGIAEDTVKHWFSVIFDKDRSLEPVGDGDAVGEGEGGWFVVTYPTSSPQFSSVFFTKAMN